MTHSVFPRARRAMPLFLAVVTALALGGCANLVGLTPPPSTLYGLEAPDDFPMTYESGDWQMIVEEPIAERALDTDRIAIYTGAHALQYYGDARWTDRAPRMLQDMLVESFENAGLSLSVGRHSIAMQPDYALVSDLRSFAARLEGEGAPPDVKVRISAKVISLPDRKIIAGNSFVARATAATNEVGAGVIAFDEATQSVIREIVNWSAQVVAQAEAEKPKPRRR